MEIILECSEFKKSLEIFGFGEIDDSLSVESLVGVENQAYMLVGWASWVFCKEMLHIK